MDLNPEFMDHSSEVAASEGMVQTSMVMMQVLSALRAIGITAYKRFPVAGELVDIAIPHTGVAFELDHCGRHDCDEHAGDSERYNRIAQAGWRIVRIPASAATEPERLFDRISSEIKFGR
ncbi:hypothetical protein [Ponticaulis sp.]|uniref:hypothetical protein n=1 Tax=Ponticaulis sp. TaxID=2020902 RepID=UPI000B63FC20|nr:hypothetical protein [Ponticaulis sp.]MAI91657.1 hypothetical protein [Ponticaulis sp.]OUX97222.1 MAG: hypothetical protein CBB65_14545 [Hyphomonadaceae bacterium TMED5]|tara:strand:- start:51852 stop:52211 length:360 start_codon:yes stop_codon:yes gene_type:complete